MVRTVEILVDDGGEKSRIVVQVLDFPLASAGVLNAADSKSLLDGREAAKRVACVVLGKRLAEGRENGRSHSFDFVERAGSTRVDALDKLDDVENITLAMGEKND